MDEAPGRELLRFEPGRPFVGLLLFLGGYGLGAGFATWMACQEVRGGASSPASGLLQAALLVALYLAGAWILFLHFVLGSRRFRFYDACFTVFTWRGRMRFAWPEVRRATLSTYRGNVELVLFIGAVRRIGVPLDGFRQAASLLAAVRARLAVPLEASQNQLALVRDH